MDVSRFPDGEIRVQIRESIRGADAFVIQPTCPPVNENLVELLVITDALKRASVGRITAVVPYLGYSRQDKKAAGREPITARMVADIMTTVGVDRMVTVDLHSSQVQGFFGFPVDHLTAVNVLARYMARKQIDDLVVVSPDAGRVKLATEYASRLNAPVVIIHKRRVSPEEPEVAHVVGEIRGKTPVIIDDMVTTGGTVDKSVRALLESGSNPEVYVMATHAVLVGRFAENLANPAIKEVIVTNTIAIAPEKQLDKITVVSIGPLIAEAIRSIHTDSSVSRLFE
jgi:ribose-phosphate pyrophosphokinase